MISSNYNNKQMWKYMKSLEINNNPRIDLPPQIMIRILIKYYFYDSIPRNDIDHNDFNYYTNKLLSHNNFRFSPTSDNTVVQNLFKINNTSLGPGGLGTNLIKKYCPFILPYYGVPIGK